MLNFSTTGIQSIIHNKGIVTSFDIGSPFKGGSRTSFESRSGHDACIKLMQECILRSRMDNANVYVRGVLGADGYNCIFHFDSNSQDFFSDV